MQKKIFNLEYQYQQYLQLVGLKESIMPQAQRDSVKRAFMGGVGQMLVLLGDVADLREGEAEITLDDMVKQVETFFVNEAAKMN